MTKKKNSKTGAFWYLLPYFSLYGLFFFLPAILIFPISLTDWSIVGSPKFVGIENYINVFSDRMFLRSLQNTVTYTLVVTLILTTISLGLAILLNQKLRGVIISRTIVIMPYVISSAVTGILWKWMFDRNFGILNTYVQQIGFQPISWLSNPNIALWSIILVNVWWSVGFNTITFLAALQGIPEDLPQAARVDGANPFQIFWYVTLPQLRPIILYLVVLCAANSFQMFDEAFVITQGGPLGSTATLVFQIYKEAFMNFRIGYSSAWSVITMLMILIITAIQMRINKDGL